MTEKTLNELQPGDYLSRYHKDGSDRGNRYCKIIGRIEKYLGEEVGFIVTEDYDHYSYLVNDHEYNPLRLYPYVCLVKNLERFGYSYFDHGAGATTAPPFADKEVKEEGDDFQEGDYLTYRENPEGCLYFHREKYLKILARLNDNFLISQIKWGLFIKDCEEFKYPAAWASLYGLTKGGWKIFKKGVSHD